MNEVTITNNQTPIEIALGVDENGMTTAKKLYEFLELNPSNYSKWIKSNITDNEFAEENIDYEEFLRRYQNLVREQDRNNRNYQYFGTGWNNRTNGYHISY